MNDGRYNDDWSRSNFSDGFSSSSRKRMNLTQGFNEFSRNIDTVDNWREAYPNTPRHLVKQRTAFTGHDRNSSSTDFTNIDEDDTTNPHRSLKNILSRFAERTSCVGPPYINSSNHFYSKFFWSVVFVGMLIGTIVNVYLNFKFYTDRPIKTTVSIGYSSLTFPAVTVCNTNPVRLSTLKMGSEDLQDFMALQNPGDLKRTSSQQYANQQHNTNVNQQNTGGNKPQNTSGNTLQPTDSSQVSPSQPVSSKNGENQTAQSNETNPQGPSAPKRQKRFLTVDQQIQSGANKTFRPPKKDIGEFGGGDKDPRFNTLEEFRYLIGLENITTRFAMSHHMTDMLLSCSFEGHTCKAANFSYFLTDDFGACFSFNQFKYDANNVPLRESYRRGNVYGLQLMLFLEVEEYIPGIATGYGARISISNPRTMPFPGSDGLFVSSGSETDIGVKMINITRLPDPYGICVDPVSFASEYGVEYTRQACQSICPHKLILEYCNCYDPSQLILYPLNTSQHYNTCNSQSDFSCISEVEYNVSVTASLLCDCPNPCHEITYDVTSSHRNWPEDGYLNALIDVVCRQPGKQAVCDELLKQTPAQQSKNFLRLNVFYRDLNFETLTEEPDYPESQLLSDLGGSIGLWVGLSVMSMVEVLELMASIVVWLGRRCFQCEKRKRKPVGSTENSQASRPPESSTGTGLHDPALKHHTDTRYRDAYCPSDPIW